MMPFATGPRAVFHELSAGRVRADKGHSGLVLTDEQAEKLEQVWADFLKKHEAAFSDALKKDHLVDLIYMQQA